MEATSVAAVVQTVDLEVCEPYCETTMSTGTRLSCWFRAAFAVVSAPMLTPAKNVEAKITPRSSAAKSPKERITLFIA